MPKLRNCTVCDTQFMSYNGIQVCSEQCMYERKRQQDIESNNRRKNNESNIGFIKECPVCGKNFNTVKRIYCSAECSSKARVLHVKENSAAYYIENRETLLEKAKARKKKT